MLIDEAIDNLENKNVNIVGSSNVVGRPLIQLMLERNCTVPIAHRYTQDLASIVSSADILIVAAGIPKLIKEERIKPDDVDFDEAVKVAPSMTPVPGGVGLMTITCLLANTLITYRLKTL